MIKHQITLNVGGESELLPGWIIAPRIAIVRAGKYINLIGIDGSANYDGLGHVILGIVEDTALDIENEVEILATKLQSISALNFLIGMAREHMVEDTNFNLIRGDIEC
ncbi:hypothetical protein ACTWQL_13735 [Pseudalkalibacillus sp. R45]|uniref:hypothetical protein n=1 Tax=Pseudalkalibacillus sp. R45 TaxID=3457433 RepID=UPI003FCC37BD